MDKILINKLNNLKKLGFDPKNILDLGAHHGLWSHSCLQVYPSSNYMLIEPINYKELESICSKIKNFEFKNLLLFEDEREVDWFEMKNTGDSIFKERTKHFENCIPTKKLTTYLDKIFTKDKFDLIKIDCQGAEINILKGGKELIINTEIIILELPFCGQWNNDVPNFCEHIQFMDSIEFVPFDILTEHRFPNSILFQIDLIFINKNSQILTKVQNHIDSQGNH